MFYLGSFDSVKILLINYKNDYRVEEEVGFVMNMLNAKIDK